MSRQAADILNVVAADHTRKIGGIVNLEPTLHIGNGGLLIQDGYFRTSDGIDATTSRGSGQTQIRNGRISIMPDNQAALEDDGLLITSGYTNQQISRSYITATGQLSSSFSVGIVAWDFPDLFSSGIYFGDNSTNRWAYMAYADTSAVTNVMSFFVEMNDGSEPFIGATASDDFRVVMDGTSDASVTVLLKKQLTATKWQIFAAHLHDGSGTFYGVYKDSGNSGKAFTVNGFNVYSNTDKPQPYIHTTGTLANTLYDDVSIPISATQTVDDGNWFRNEVPGIQSGEGCVLIDVELTYWNGSSTPFIFGISADANNRINASITTGALRFLVRDGGVTQALITGASGISSGDRLKFGVAWASNSIAIFVQGGSLQEDTGATIPDALTSFMLGNYPVAPSDNFASNSHFHAMRYIPYRPTNPELQVLVNAL